MEIFKALTLCALTLSQSAVFALAPFDERPAKNNEWGTRPAEGELVKSTPAPFVWREQPDAAKYEVEYARDAKFSKESSLVKDIPWNALRPSKTMEPGAWNWRVRYIDAKGTPSAWSSTRKFEIAPDASPEPMPEWKDLMAEVPKGHPRIFMRPEDVQAYRARIAGDLKDEYADLIRQCDELLKNPPSTEEPAKYPENIKRPSKEWMALWWGNRLKVLKTLGGAATLGFGYKISGDMRYGELAKKTLMECAKWDPQGATSRPYNDEAGMPYMSRFSRTYSFVNDLLAEKEKAECRAVMRIRGNEAFKALYPRQFFHPYDSHSNRLWHFLGEAGLVFLGEIPEAENWLRAAMNVYFCVYPVWGDEDGGWCEGLCYWYQYQERFLWWGDIMKKAFGINIADRRFYSQTGYYAMYVCPPGTKDGGFGDLADLCRTHQGVAMAALASFGGNPHWKWYAEKMAPVGKEDSYIAFARKSQKPVEAKSPEELPSSRVFRGVGLACLNTNLADGTKNVQIQFKSSPAGNPSHGYDANNSFLVNAFGERLLVRSGQRDCYGSDFHKNWMWETKSENNILVDGQGQLKCSRDAKGEIVDFISGPRFDYVAGEAVKSYQPGILKSYVRRILFHKPGTILIVDTLQAEKPSAFNWLLHSCEPMKIESQHKISIENKGAACEADFLYPGDLKLSQTDKFDPPLPPHVKLVQSHLRADTPQKADKALFITLIRPYRTGSPAPRKAEMEENADAFEIGVPESDGPLKIEVSKKDFSIKARAADGTSFETKR